MAQGFAKNVVPHGNCRFAIIDGWWCKIYDDGYAECHKQMSVTSVLSGWNSTNAGFKYGTWVGPDLPGKLDMNLKNGAKKYEFAFSGASRDGYILCFALLTNGTPFKMPSVTGYSLYSVNSQIEVDHFWSVKGWFDFSGKNIVYV
jgi:hypothetical protein